MLLECLWRRVSATRIDESKCRAPPSVTRPWTSNHENPLMAALAAVVEAEDAVVWAPRLKLTSRCLSFLSWQEVEQFEECLLKECS